jgi:hypothetical protein
MDRQSIEGSRNTNMNRCIVLMLTACLGVLTVNAHDPSKHKGTPMKGEIVSIATDSFDLLTNSQKFKVSLTSTTKIEHGNQLVKKDQLHKRTHVAVFGTKLPSGEIVAREVIIVDGARDKKHGGHK